MERTEAATKKFAACRATKCPGDVKAAEKQKQLAKEEMNRLTSQFASKKIDLPEFKHRVEEASKDLVRRSAGHTCTITKCNREVVGMFKAMLAMHEMSCRTIRDKRQRLLMCDRVKKALAILEQKTISPADYAAVLSVSIDRASMM